MNVYATRLPGVLLIEPLVFSDARGKFFETFNARRYLAAGAATPFVQDNVSVSSRGVLRGLHFQHPHGQAKLVQVLHGEVFDVAVDVRYGSPTFGHWVAEYLSGENCRQLLIPSGFAHGFIVTSAQAVFSYKCSEYYRPDCEHSIRWDDPALGIRWPAGGPVLSDKDRNAPTIAETAPSVFPRAETPCVADGRR